MPAMPAMPALPDAPPTAAPPVPTRRPEAGYYRPGGTSNYKPASAIMAGADEANPSGVTPVSFESPAGP